VPGHRARCVLASHRRLGRGREALQHLVQAALEMAYAQRSPREVVHHPDHGGECTRLPSARAARSSGAPLDGEGPRLLRQRDGGVSVCDVRM
jgi:hypothetical protein